MGAATQLDLLSSRGLVTDDALTASGHATAERLLDARRECLVSLVADWSYDDDPRVNDAVARLAEDSPANRLPREFRPVPSLVRGCTSYEHSSNRLQTSLTQRRTVGRP